MIILLSILGCRFFHFRTLNISCYSFLACTVSAEKSADSLKGIPLYMTLCIFLATFRILSLSFGILIMISLGMGLFGFILFATFYVSCTWISVSFFRFGKFSTIIFSNTFSIPFSLSSTSGVPIMCRLAGFVLSHRSCMLLSFFFH